MDRYKNKRHNQHKGQCNPNLNKKVDMDRKEKENKIRRAKLLGLRIIQWGSSRGLSPSQSLPRKTAYLAEHQA